MKLWKKSKSNSINRGDGGKRVHHINLARIHRQPWNMRPQLFASMSKNFKL